MSGYRFTGATENSSVVAIGNFDGVHRGHQAVLEQASRIHPGRTIVAVTFWPHPMAVVRPDKAPRLLTSLEERTTLLAEAGADHVEVVGFSPEVAGWSPELFIEEILRPLNAGTVVVGSNFRFGHRASGTVDDLRAAGLEVLDVDLIQTGHTTTSSTEIRRLVAAGDVAEAEQHLGRRFRFSGIVVRGHQRGRELGFPTANLPVPRDRAVPADGVYSGYMRRLDVDEPEVWPAAISVGKNPTFDDVADAVVEAHVIDRDDLDLYGVPVAVDFVDFLRGNVKFTGIDSLIDQIGLDVDHCRASLRALPEGERWLRRPLRPRPRE